MQELYGEHKGVNYCFVLMETFNKILVWRDDNFSYMIQVLNNGNLNCSCLGNRHHGHCKHIDYCKEHFNFGRIVKPRTFIGKANEYYIANYLNNLKEVTR